MVLNVRIADNSSATYRDSSPGGLSELELSIFETRNTPRRLQSLQERDKVILVLLGKVKIETRIVEVDSVHQSSC